MATLAPAETSSTSWRRHARKTEDRAVGPRIREDDEWGVDVVRTCHEVRAVGPRIREDDGVGCAAPQRFG